MIRTSSIPVKAPFHLMAKPRGAICNLECTYCYFLEKEALYPGSDFRMSSTVLEAFTQQYIEAQPTNHVTFSWHGGEPMLSGLPFYVEALEFQKKYRRPGMVIENTIQTNGVLIDAEWAQFFADNGFLVGLSIDGPGDVHDRFRVDKGSKPSFERVVEGLKHLRQAGVNPNFLCTVTSASEGHGKRIYRFLRDDLGAEFIQFIPVVEKSDVDDPSPVTVETISAAGYGQFLKEVFFEWYPSDTGEVFVQMFEVALASWLGVPRGLCVYEETCGNALAVEHSGDVYSCDHFVEPRHRLGNLVFVPLSEMVSGAQQRDFGLAKQNSLPRYCRECPVLFACNGGCPKDRFISTPGGEPGLNFLCEGLKDFFLSIDTPMREIAEKVA